MTRKMMIEAVVGMDRAAKELAGHYRKFNEASAVARRAAYATKRGEFALEELNTALSTLPVDLAMHMAGLGLAPLVADAAVARRASRADTTDTFVERWTKRL
jgi:hypothetical protein